MKQHRTLRRGLGVLLGLVMCLTLLTVTALAAEPATETADFTTDANAALALLNAAKTEGAANSTWDSTANKLTLKGVNFTTSASDAVILPDGAVIELVGDNTITSVSENTGTSCGISANGSLTIQGSGTLIVTGSEADEESCGIYAFKDMTISGGTVTATGGEAGRFSYGINAYAVTISDTAKVEATSGETDWFSYGIHTDGDITISDTAKVTAQSGKAENYSCGIYVEAGNVAISGGTVTATGGTAGTYSDGIYTAYDVTISGGTVTATGGNVTGEDSESYGIESWDGEITISGGTVTATGGTADRYSEGIYAEYDVIISGGTVTATGGNVTGEDSESYGIYIYANAVTISGTAKVEATGGTAGRYSEGIYAEYDVIISGTAKVEATGGEADEASYGIRTYGDITISDTAKVTATGGEADEVSYGICTSGDITISGGTVTATGGNVTGEDSESYGIESWDGEITISGGTVTATGGKADRYSEGIYAGYDVIISGGTVTATGGEADGFSYGINANAVTISNTAEVEATGGTAGRCSEGIYAEYDVIISGGTVTATGGNVTGEDSESYGIESWEGEITISGGRVTARTLAGAGATKRMGLNVAPTLSEHTGYNWRTSPENAFTASTTTPYTYDTAHTYFEVITNPFEDVPGGAYYYDAVQWAFAEGITAGTSDTTFSPNAPCTRAQAVTFLWRTAGTPEPTTTNNPFTDVKPDDYYYKAVLWAVENKIVYGIDETTFGPKLDCSRAQVVAFLWRAKGEPEPTTTNNPFTDVDTSEYYGKAVIWAAENKSVYGITTTQFSPRASCTRAQIVSFLYRTYGN